MMSKLFTMAVLVLFALGMIAPVVQADPCGMVPPMAVSGNPNKYLTRVGEQLTYIFHKDGIADMVLQPAFEGKVDNFGMLIPFPAPPAIRKVSDDIFAQVENTVNPPKVDLWVGNYLIPCCEPEVLDSITLDSNEEFDTVRKSEVRVLNEEAVGMYQVAVLEAGSSDALQGWMTKNQYMFPEGMSEVVDDYVAMRWVFVAVKAKIGETAGVAPKAGIQSVNHSLPEGTTFAGKVQAMAFRYRCEDLTIPMRLASYNAGELKNTVYLLTDQPVRISQLPEGMVKQQITGEQIYKHLTDMLPATYRYYDNKGERSVDVVCGEMPDIDPKYTGKMFPKEWHMTQRNPNIYNGKIKQLIEADLFAVRNNRLSLAFEERSKALLNISEDLGIRGEDIDALIATVIAEERDQLLANVLDDLKSMTFTVIKGEFPRDTLRDSNLTLGTYTLPASSKPKQGSLWSNGLLSLFALLLAASALYIMTVRRLPILTKE